MKTILSLILAAFMAPLAHAQMSCSQGSVPTGAQNTPITGCTPVSMSTGTYIEQKNLTAAMSSQTICSASIDPADPQYCAAGFYRLDVQIRPAVVGTLVSAIASSITYTDDVGAVTDTLVANLSLVQAKPAESVYAFYKVAGTAVTVQTSVTGTLTGGAAYNFRARLFRAPGS